MVMPIYSPNSSPKLLGCLSTNLDTGASSMLLSLSLSFLSQSNSSARRLCSPPLGRAKTCSMSLGSFNVSGTAPSTCKLDRKHGNHLQHPGCIRLSCAYWHSSARKLAGKFRKAHCNSQHVGFKKASCFPDLRWSAADLCQRKPCSAGSRCLIDTCFRWRDQFSQHLWTCTSSKERLVSSCRLNPLRATSGTTFQFIGQANEKWKQMKAMVTE